MMCACDALDYHCFMLARGSIAPTTSDHVFVHILSNCKIGRAITQHGLIILDSEYITVRGCLSPSSTFISSNHAGGHPHTTCSKVKPFDFVLNLLCFTNNMTYRVRVPILG